MLHAGLDLSRRRLDVCLLDEHGELRGRDRGAAGRRWPARAGAAAARVSACGRVIESMNGARFVHDTLEEHGWEVLVADAQKVKGLAPLACKTDRIDARVLARACPSAIWCRRSGCPTRRSGASASWRASGLHLVRHRTTLKNRIHATLIAFGHPCPVSDLFGTPAASCSIGSRSPSRGARNVDVSLAVIDDLEMRIARLDGRAPAPGRRSPLHPAAGHRARVRLGQRLHGRVRDRRHRALRVAGEAVRLHRPVPARAAVRQHRPARPDLKARPALSALGAV